MNPELESQLTPPPVRGQFEPMYKLWPFWALPEDILRVTNAMVISMHQHTVAAKPENRVRKYTGMPYWTHPFRVTMRLATYPQVKLFWLCAGLLHDTVEDTVYDPEEVYTLKHRIVEECGEDVLQLVEELTNEKIYVDGRRIPRRQQKEHDWKRLKASSHAAKIIKMLDRIDNLTEMVGSPVDFKKLYCQESEELLKAIGDADKSIAWQLQTAIEFPYIWRKFNQAELEQKPKGLVFENSKRGEGFIEEAGPGGHIRFVDGSWFYFDGKVGEEGNFVQDPNLFIDRGRNNPIACTMRETGTSVKTAAGLKQPEKKNEGTQDSAGSTGCG